MALPTTEIEQIAREPVHTPGWSGRLLMFSSTMLVLAIFAWLGLDFGYKVFLESRAVSLDKEIQELNNAISKEDQIRIQTYFSQVRNLNDVLDKHLYLTTGFGFLQKSVLPGIYYKKLVFKPNESKMTLGGVGNSLQAITQQVQILEASPEIEDATLLNSDFQEDANIWQFNLDVVMKDKFLNQNRMLDASSTNTSST